MTEPIQGQAPDLTERLAKSNAYYDRFAERVAARSEQRDFRRAIVSFERRLAGPGVVLDVGCGAGQHLALSRNLGHQVLGVEPSTESRAICASRGLPVVDGAFETLDKLALPPVTGVWCAASLLHVPVEELPSTVDTIAALLPPSGPLFVTVRLGEGRTWDRWDDEGGDAARLIQYFDDEKLITTLENAGFRIAEQWIDETVPGRPCRWISIVAERSD